LNASKRRKVKMLERRKAFLLDQESDNPWDLHEIAALEFAIETISAHYPEPAS